MVLEKLYNKLVGIEEKLKESSVLKIPEPKPDVTKNKHKEFNVLSEIKLYGFRCITDEDYEKYIKHVEEKYNDPKNVKHIADYFFDFLEGRKETIYNIYKNNFETLLLYRRFLDKNKKTESTKNDYLRIAKRTNDYIQELKGFNKENNENRFSIFFEKLHQPKAYNNNMKGKTFGGYKIQTYSRKYITNNLIPIIGKNKFSDFQKCFSKYNSVKNTRYKRCLNIYLDFLYKKNYKFDEMDEFSEIIIPDYINFLEQHGYSKTSVYNKIGILRKFYPHMRTTRKIDIYQENYYRKYVK